jgi:uncharacterized membrane protein
MPTDDQYEELLRKIAALTERVYKLEHQAGLYSHQNSAQRSHARPQEDALTDLIQLERRLRRASKPASKRESDLESQIGGQWLNRVGIIAVLIGVSYFLKYAFDNAWVGPAGRVLIGLTSGLGIVFWSEHVRRNGYAIFSYSLKAIGIGVLYLSLWASSQLYQLVPNAMAFAAMTAVTGATIGMALWQDAEVIAAFAALGAFITPVALSTGQNNAVSLFTYVTILDAGALVLVRYRPWIRILAGSYVGTLLLYSAWHSNYYTPDQFQVAIASVSAAFLVFALTPFIDRRERDTNGIMIVALANAAAYFFEVWELFEHASESREAALAAAGLGCLYFAASYALTISAPAAIAQLHAAIGAAFLVVAVPIGFEQQWITIGWLVEAAALIEVSRRTARQRPEGTEGNETMRILGAAALALGVLRVLIVDDYDTSHILLNERMLVSAIAVAALALTARRWIEAAPVLIIALNIVALVALNREVRDTLTGLARNFAYSALWMAYGAGLMTIGFWKASRFLRWQALILIFVTICKVFLYDTSSLDRGYRILSLIALGLLLLVTSFLYQRDFFKLEDL